LLLHVVTFGLNPAAEVAWQAAAALWTCSPAAVTTTTVFNHSACSTHQPFVLVPASFVDNQYQQQMYGTSAWLQGKRMHLATMWLGICGLALMAMLMLRRVKGAIMVGE
jgi:hypothetical protein